MSREINVDPAVTIKWLDYFGITQDINDVLDTLRTALRTGNTGLIKTAESKLYAIERAFEDKEKAVGVLTGEEHRLVTAELEK